MFRVVLFVLMFVLGLAALVAVAAGPAAQERPSVVAEPLNCQAFDRQVVCTDRSMHGEAVCAQLDRATVYCTTRRDGLGLAGGQVVAAATAVVPKL